MSLLISLSVERKLIKWLNSPQGGRHTVLRWTHRSFFRIPTIYRSLTHLNIPIPPLPSSLSSSSPSNSTSNLFIHGDWAGTIVVESEGTNEGLAELQERCGSAFPQFRKTSSVSASIAAQHTGNGNANGNAMNGQGLMNGKGKDKSRVWRLLRDRSKPGEIWIRLVREKDRVM